VEVAADRAHHHLAAIQANANVDGYAFRALDIGGIGFY
jgi:hypothetical protein